MKVSFKWLSSFVDIEDDIDSLKDKLTFAGLEVERTEVIGADYNGVVVGEILEIDQHPNADKLKLCLVDFGTEENIRVVCGAPNTKVGGKFPFAPVGTILPNGVKLKKAKIRGETSLGMLCAKDELGLGEDHSGLMELNSNLKPGTPFVDVVGPPDQVIELEITPNRPDCLSMIGIAREVSALYDLPLKNIDLKEMKTDDSSIHVEVTDKDKCPCYTARVIKNVKVDISPQWIQSRLEAAGIRPINNIVDITNYVMLETGHPMHAFDMNLINGQNIFVRYAKNNEKFISLDGETLELSDNMMVISDKNKPIALAGIIGGESSGINNDTTNIILEAAVFDTSSTRSTSKKLGIYTESSYRFQRGVSPHSVLDANIRAANLIMELCPTAEPENVIILNQINTERQKINFSWSFITKKIGFKIPKAEIKGIFKKLSIEIVDDNNDTAIALIPHFRLDLKLEIDLVEEVARMYGVNDIPENTPIAKVVEGASNKRYAAFNNIRSVLQGLGVSEIMNYSLVNHSLLDEARIDNINQRESLPHPISEEQSVLRTSLIPQMLESIGRNHSRQIKELCFYEIGKVFKRVDNDVLEYDHLSIGLLGPVGRNLLNKQEAVNNEEQFIWIKGLIEELITNLKVSNLSFKESTNQAFNANQVLDIFVDDQKIGLFGIISKEIGQNRKINEPIALAELDIALLLNYALERSSVDSIPIYPYVSRDLSLVLEKSITHESIMALINKFRPKFLESVNLFDIYDGKGIPEGKKSIGYNFIYRSSAETLTDKKVNKVHEKLMHILSQELSAEIRV